MRLLWGVADKTSPKSVVPAVQDVVLLVTSGGVIQHNRGG